MYGADILWDISVCRGMQRVTYRMHVEWHDAAVDNVMAVEWLVRRCVEQLAR